MQDELVEIEFNEFARGKDDITIVDFTRLIFRYTTIKVDDQSAYIQRVNERMVGEDQVGVKIKQNITLAFRAFPNSNSSNFRVS